MTPQGHACAPWFTMTELQNQAKADGQKLVLHDSEEAARAAVLNEEAICKP